jgi:adenylate kinase
MSGLSRLRSLAPLRLRLLSTRAYGSASAAQLQYDYSEDEVEEDERMPRGMAETEGWDWVPGRGVQWVLMGDRGIKRHVYGERLSKLLEVPHISMGTLVRQELHPRSSLYKQVLSSLFFFLSHIKVPIFLEGLRLCLAGLCIMCFSFHMGNQMGIGKFNVVLM